jgi:hypothetical protein
MPGAQPGDSRGHEADAGRGRAADLRAAAPHRNAVLSWRRPGPSGGPGRVRGRHRARAAVHCAGWPSAAHSHAVGRATLRAGARRGGWLGSLRPGAKGISGRVSLPRGRSARRPPVASEHADRRRAAGGQDPPGEPLVGLGWPQRAPVRVPHAAPICWLLRPLAVALPRRVAIPLPARGGALADVALAPGLLLCAPLDRQRPLVSAPTTASAPAAAPAGCSRVRRA